MPSARRPGPGVGAGQAAGRASILGVTSRCCHRNSLEPPASPCLASPFLEPARQTHPALGCVLGTEPGAAQGRLSGRGTGPQGLHLSALGAQPLLRGARLCPGEVRFWGAGPIARGGVKWTIVALGGPQKSRNWAGPGRGSQGGCRLGTAKAPVLIWGRSPPQGAGTNIQPASQPPTHPVTHPATHPASHPPSHPPNYPLTQPASHPVTQPPSHQATHPVSHPVTYPATQLSTQLPSHPPSHPAIHPASQPASHPASQPATHPAIQPPTQQPRSHKRHLPYPRDPPAHQLTTTPTLVTAPASLLAPA